MHVTRVDNKCDYQPIHQTFILLYYELKYSFIIIHRHTLLAFTATYSVALFL